MAETLYNNGAKPLLNNQALGGTSTVKTDTFKNYPPEGRAGLWGEVTSPGVVAVELYFEAAARNVDTEFVVPDGVTSPLKSIVVVGKFAIPLLPQCALPFQRIRAVGVGANNAGTGLTLIVPLTSRNHP